MQTYAVILAPNDDYTTAWVEYYQADDVEHAREQARDAYPDEDETAILGAATLPAMLPEPDQFDKYIQHGHAAILTHPDYPRGIDMATAAADTIASILHAVFGRRPLEDVTEDVNGLLGRAARSFDGDYEDMEVTA